MVQSVPYWPVFLRFEFGVRIDSSSKLEYLETMPQKRHNLELVPIVAFLGHALWLSQQLFDSLQMSLILNESSERWTCDYGFLGHRHRSDLLRGLKTNPARL